jgi:hypothetical protein
MGSMASDWRQGEWEWDEEREQPVRRRVVVLPYTIVITFLGALSMSFLLLFPPSAGASPTEEGLIYPGRTLRPARRLLDSDDAGGGSLYYPDHGGPSQGSDYSSDYEVYSDYDYVTRADMKRRWATAAPSIIHKTATQLLTQSNRLVCYTSQAPRSSTPLHCIPFCHRLFNVHRTSRHSPCFSENVVGERLRSRRWRSS